MITINYRGSYAKQPQRTGTRGCEPSDRDLMALDEEVWRSNLGRGSEIERLRVKGARAAALAAPAASLAAAACRSSPKPVLQGSFRLGFGSVGVYVTWVNYWGQKRGSAGDRAARTTAQVASLVGVQCPKH